MRILEVIERIFSLCLALLVGFALIQQACNVEIPGLSWESGARLLSALEKSQAGPMGVASLGFLFCLMALVIVWELHRRSRREELWSAATDVGRIGITSEAIQQLVLKTCTQWPVIVQAKPAVRITRGRVEVRCSVKALEVPELSTSDLCRQVQEAIRTCVTETLGISDIASIHVTVTRMELRPLRQEEA